MARLRASPSLTCAASCATRPLLRHLALQKRMLPTVWPPNKIVLPQYAHDAIATPPEKLACQLASSVGD
jgi:hypothetical protein